MNLDISVIKENFRAIKDLTGDLIKIGLTIEDLIDVEVTIKIANICLDYIKKGFKDAIVKAGGLSSPEDLKRAIDSFEYIIEDDTILLYADIPEDLTKEGSKEKSEKENKKDQQKNKDSKEYTDKLKQTTIENRLKNRIVRENLRLNDLKKIIVKTRRFFQSRNRRIKDKDKQLNVGLAVNLAVAKFQRSYPTVLKPEDPVKFEDGKIMLVEQDKPSDKKKLIFKSLPLTTKRTKNWIHPGILRMGFIQVAMRRASFNINKILEERLKEFMVLNKIEELK
jgi:hypothetical protein